MTCLPRFPRKPAPLPVRARALIPLSLLLALVPAGSLKAAQLPLAPPDQPIPVVVPNPAFGPNAPAATLTLGDCIQLALQRQPRLAAQRASPAPARAGARPRANRPAPGRPPPR